MKKCYLIGKRLFDICFSCAGIMISSPVWLLTAAAIRLETPGKVIFVQKRVGKDGMPFLMYKFRSMYVDAEKRKKELALYNMQIGSPVFKMKDDPRITKVGRIIRKTSIDELPQLINILKGDMSIVGPRPALPEEVEYYSDYERKRLRVTPGLTCYWQCCGRSNISFEKWMELDMKYIEEQSFWTDIRIILKTIVAVLTMEGAE